MTGIAMIAGVACLILLIAFGRFLPGVGGEFFGRVLGIISTPFLMETSFIILGLVLVMTLNIWRQRRDGDELVYLEEVKDAPTGLPDQARWAVYREAPLDNSPPSSADLLEGAVAIGDHESAVTLLATMSDEERTSPAVMHQRILLAHATGRGDLAQRLEQQLLEEG